MGSGVRTSPRRPNQWCVWRSGSAPECEPGGRRFDPDHAPQLHRPIGGTGRRSGFKSRGRKACRFEACIGHQHSSPRGGIGRRTGLRSRGPRACPFESDRGDQDKRAIAQKAESKALIRPGSVVRIHLARPVHALSSEGRAPDSYSGGPRFDAESAYQMKGRKRAASVTWL